ncbi:hypothetical protein [Daejeonella sp.]|uniref:hypothetical protein n=1 Tax=Daejeonella sp. TaxID=2805397 RepID=UPI0030BA8E81
MLSFISWPQYFAALAIIGFAYYSFILVRYYRAELLAFSQPKSAASKIPVTTFTGNFIGGIKPDPGETSIDSEDIQFPDDKLETEILTEIRALIHAFKGLDQKDEFLSLLSLIISKYPGNEFDRPLLTEQVLQHSESLTFSIDQADIERAYLQTA